MRQPSMGVALAALMLVGVGEAGAQDRRLTAIDAYVRKARAEWQAPAVALAIVKDDSVVFARGYGVRTAGRPEPADEHTLFAIGSASKAFTTASLAMLIDEGKLGWNDRAGERLPGWRLQDPWVTREIRIRDLVAHRVGLERADAMWHGTDFSREELLHRQRFIGSAASFRFTYGYNNHMFLVAGEVIRAISGRSWDDFVRTRIFAPLGMRRSNTSTRAFTDPNVATPHAAVGDSVVPIPWFNLDNMGPAGSINSSVREMAEWVRLQLAGGVHGGRRLVSEAGMAEMHAPQTVIPLEPWLSSASPVNHQMVPGTNFFLYGLGWFLQDYKGRKIVHHGGSIDGMRGLVGMIPSERLGLVVLTNLNPSSLDEAVMFRVFDEYLGGVVRDWSAEMLAGTRRLAAAARARADARRTERVTGTRPSRPLAEYAGTYADSAYGSATVGVENGGLTIRFESRSGRLEHWHYDTFNVAWTGPVASSALVTFRLDAQGRPAALAVPGFPELMRTGGGSR